MSMHLQGHYYFWYFVLFHFVDFRNALTSTSRWESRWTSVRRPAWEHSFKFHFLFWQLFHFILFYFVWSETLTQAHACGCALVVNQMIGDKFVDFAWVTYVWPQVPDCLELIVFVLFCCSACKAFRRRNSRITRIIVLFFSITDDPCLVLSCLTARTLRQGAHNCWQQLVRTWQTISPWPCCSWPTPSSR